MGKALQDDQNRSLETTPVGKRAKTKGELTVGATIPAEKNRAGQSVKVGLDKPVPPDSPMTAWAIRRPGPGKKLALLENFLDADIHLE
jgi:hypothetical protein